MQRNVLYAATRNAYQDMMVSMKSLLHHTEIDNVFLFVEDELFPYEIPDFVKPINVSGEWKLFDNGNCSGYFLTYMCLLRGIASRYLDVDTVLSLDNDTIIKKDASGIWDYDISDYYFAAAWEHRKNWAVLPDYVNFGVSLLNLKKLRSVEEIILSVLNACKLEFGEQDALNIICKGHILKIPSIYNANPYMMRCKEHDVVIRHYAGRGKEDFYNDPDYSKYIGMSWDEVLRKGE